MKATTTTATKTQRHANPESLSQLVCLTHRHFPEGDASQAFAILLQRCRIFMLSLKAKDCSLLSPEDHIDRSTVSGGCLRYGRRDRILLSLLYRGPIFLRIGAEGSQNNDKLSLILKADARPGGLRSRRCLAMYSQGRAYKHQVTDCGVCGWYMEFLALHDC